MTYILSIKAQMDLQDIWLYTFENWSLDQADNYIRSILAEIEQHAVNPEKGIERTRVRNGYRCFQVKSHVIFYRTIDHVTDIEVIRVLHKRMDIENRLLD